MPTRNILELHANMLKSLLIILLLTLTLALTSCKKSWLDAKPDKALVVPKTLEDCQALLDNNANVFNSGSPVIGELASDNFFVTSDAIYNARTSLEKNVYIWAAETFKGLATSNDWNNAYEQVYYANTVLEALSKIEVTPSNVSNWSRIKGSALFLRSFAFNEVAQLFCKPFIAATAATDLGIPLRLSPDFNERSVRSTVKETYDRIINDLLEAKSLLPASILPNTQLTKTRPSKVASFALLARIFLAMQKYDEAFAYSDTSLQLYNKLMNFGDTNPLTAEIASSGIFKVKRYNSETIFYSTMLNPFMFNISNHGAVPAFFNSYHTNDLRRTVFFRPPVSGRAAFCGSYGQSQPLFNGLAVDEIYLIRAECKARKGEYLIAMDDLNTLLAKRWKIGFYTNMLATNAADALNKILIERRKELCFRGLRWVDLRRLNQDPAFAITLTRTVNNQTYELLPNSNKYVFPFPPDVIQITGMPQNPR